MTSDPDVDPPRSPRAPAVRGKPRNPPSLPAPVAGRRRERLPTTHTHNPPTTQHPAHPEEVNAMSGKSYEQTGDAKDWSDDDVADWNSRD